MTTLQLPTAQTLTAADLPGIRTGHVRGLYMHVPFCFHKCHYCDFYSIVDSQDRQEQFVDRLIEEIVATRVYCKGPIETIFVGGGTPTLLSASNWVRILESVASNVALNSKYEFTVEANPETVTPELARALADGGVNRISIGAQSFYPHLLDALERHHDPENVGRSIKIVRDAGITNVNVDLIFAIPGQSLGEWKRDLETAMELQPSHISCYGLVYEPNTALTKRLDRGDVLRVDEDVEAAMYEHAIDELHAAAYEHYEISNWATPGLECRHNLLYWQNVDWWPIGPSASGHVAGLRWKNAPRLTAYLDSAGLPPIQDVEHLDDDGRLGEELMLAFRLQQGIAESTLEHRLRCSGPNTTRWIAIQRHLDSGLLERIDGRVRLSRPGLLLADQVLADLV